MIAPSQVYWSEDARVRTWVVENIGLFVGVKRRVIGILLTVMAGDPFPEVRSGALEGLVQLKLLGGLGSDEDEIVKGCFWRGLEILTYAEDSVRRDAVRVVRRSVCQSLRRLGTLSSAFTVEAMNYLMDMLNDDEIAVRLQALGTMHYMATQYQLFVPSAHMHMLLGCLNVNSSLIRYAVRKVMKVAKLSNLDFFKASVHVLIKNLEIYPQDEDGVMSALFNIGQHHGDFLICIFSEVSHEIEPTSGGNLNFDCAQVAALLVLSISARLSPNVKLA